jgi:hypothetical protein
MKKFISSIVFVVALAISTYAQTADQHLKPARLLQREVLRPGNHQFFGSDQFEPEHVSGVV